jgi:hypothetical protein
MVAFLSPYLQLLLVATYCGGSIQMCFNREDKANPFECSHVPILPFGKRLRDDVVPFDVMDPSGLDLCRLL